MKNRICFFLTMLLFEGALFITFDGCFLYPYRGATMRGSRLILCALVVGMIVIITVNNKKSKFGYEDMLLGFFPYCIYYISSIYRYYPWVVIVSCAMIGLFLTVVVIAWKTDRHVHARSPQVRKKYRKQAMNLAGRGITYILIVTLVGTEVVTTFADKLPSIKPNQTIQELMQSHAYELSKDDPILANLKDSVWRGLSDSERIEILQHVAEIEQIYLGIPAENILTVKKSILEPQTLGQFCNSTYEIKIQADHLKDPSFNVLQTLLHECHHALARKEVELLETLPEKYQSLYLFRDVTKYQQEEGNYISEGPGYFAQLLEIDAESYSKERLNDYLIFFLE